MDQFPTEEEEFELMYNEDLELLDEINDEEINNFEKVVPRPLPSGPSRLSNISHLNKSQNSLLQSPQLSQISFDSAIAGPSTAVNRRLFGTPGNTALKRICSTPFPQAGPSTLPPDNDTSLPPATAGAAEYLPFESEPMEFDALQEIQNIGLNRKRRLEDLFGDIQDIEREEYIDPEAKKKKNEEERDTEMINKILQARKKARETKNPLQKDNIEKLNALHDFKMRNLSYMIPSWPCITLVRSNSDRVYVRMHSDNFETQHINEINVFGKGYSGLLGESKEEIWNSAREITLKRLTSIPPPMSETTETTERIGKTRKNEKLWVDKYKPKKYLDLLSDETTNRSLLFWLKMWDKIVFGREFRINDTNKTSQLNTFNKRTGKFESTGGWNRRNKQNLNIDRDEHGRPIQKVALLCGPPGLGKTTLAHTIACHAGYSVREMNASDDRNPEAFRLALENGTQMTSVLNADRRPNCIVLDEIDGAPMQSIEFLIQFISDNYISKAKKGKEKKNILKRPIICICNDMYTPALRQLRQVAFVVNFPPIESSRLAERLLEISRKENLKTDLGTLLALSEKSGNDVRSCISMMQFFNANKKTITLQDVLNSNLGQKDRHRGLFAVWSAIFQIQRPRRQLLETSSRYDNKEAPMVTMSNMSSSTRAKHILEVVHMGGDYERLLQGVYENYLNQKMPDPNLDGVVEATNWFCFSDAIQKQINHLQNYSIYPYLQFGFITWHLLFASLAWPKINFPNKDYEVNKKTTTQKMIFVAFKKGITCGTIGIGQGNVILNETVPLLKRILSPTLRSISLQLLTTKERYDLTHTVGVMADLGLLFTQTKTAEGTYQYSIEPDIDMLSKFPGSQGITLSYFGRQLISREVELEQMRRSAPKSSAQESNSIQDNKKTKSTNASTEKSPTPVQNLPNHLQFLKPKILQKKLQKEVVSKDFFGRITTKQTSSTTKEGTSDPIVKSPIWYRYKEGFNNAVRKDVIMSELL